MTIQSRKKEEEGRFLFFFNQGFPLIFVLLPLAWTLEEQQQAVDVLSEEVVRASHRESRATTQRESKKVVGIFQPSSRRRLQRVLVYNMLTTRCPTPAKTSYKQPSNTCCRESVKRGRRREEGWPLSSTGQERRTTNWTRNGKCARPFCLWKQFRKLIIAFFMSFFQAQ